MRKSTQARKALARIKALPAEQLKLIPRGDCVQLLAYALMDELNELGAGLPVSTFDMMKVPGHLTVVMVTAIDDISREEVKKKKKENDPILKAAEAMLKKMEEENAETNNS